MSLRPPLVAICVVTLAIAGCGGGDDPAPADPPATGTSDEATGASAQPGTDGDQTGSGEDDTTKIWVTTGEQLTPVEREFAGDDTQAEAEAAAEALIDGPTGAERQGKLDAGTEIPASTDVQGVTVDDGVATVELSDDFLGSIPAQARARSTLQDETLSARLSQVTYTLTQFDSVDSAKVVSGGVSVDVAKDREDFAKPDGGPPPISKPKGTPSAATRQLQERLAKLRYLPANAVDGLDGYRTQQAVIAFQSWQGLQRDGIVGPQTSAALRNAKRPKPKNSGPSTRIEVYRSKGVALLIRNNRTKRAVHVSTGAPGTVTPSGSYEVFRKEKMSWSVPFQQWLPYASYFNNGIAFHEYAQVPTYPVSHGCVRVPSPEAKFVYKFAAIGTAVVVY